MIEKSNLDEKTIKEETKKHYNLDIDKIEVINGGEVHVINHLKQKGLPVPEYIPCINNQSYFEYNSRIIILQKFFEGKIIKND